MCLTLRNLNEGKGNHIGCPHVVICKRKPSPTCTKYTCPGQGTFVLALTSSLKHIFSLCAFCSRVAARAEISHDLPDQQRLFLINLISIIPYGLFLFQNRVLDTSEMISNTYVVA